MAKKNPYCIMPWVHFHVGNKGVVKACCVANIPFGNINREKFEDIWSGNKITALRDKFLTGEPDKRCSTCINIEASGGVSIRQETLAKYESIYQQQTNSGSTKIPFYFDIRFSNVCNFSCRTCWHGASSKWFKDAQHLGTNLGKSAIIKNIDDYNVFIKKIGHSILNAKEIYFAGGEPLVTEEHYLLLEYLIKNNATDIHLRYNTNFSVLNFKQYNVLSLWKHFDHVEILASIDATASLGEYIRKEFDWKLFVGNRRKIDHLSNISFKISPTVSVFNIRHLPKLYSKCIEMELIEKEDIYINILERPYHYNIQCLPYDYKQLVVKEFKRFTSWLFTSNYPESVISAFDECIKYMMDVDRSNQWLKFLKETDRMDILRNESISNVLDISTD